jgi:hypothetical protein
VSLDNLSKVTLSIPAGTNRTCSHALVLSLVMFDANPDFFSEALFDNLTRKKVKQHTATETTAPQEQQGVLHPENQMIGINMKVALHSICFKLVGVVEGPTYGLVVVVRSEDSGHHVFKKWVRFSITGLFDQTAVDISLPLHIHGLHIASGHLYDTHTSLSEDDAFLASRNKKVWFTKQEDTKGIEERFFISAEDEQVEFERRHWRYDIQQDVKFFEQHTKISDPFSHMRTPGFVQPINISGNVGGKFSNFSKSWLLIKLTM